MRKLGSREREAADASGVFRALSQEEAAAMVVALEEDRLERLSVRSPISGRMLTRRTQDLPGRFLPAGALIARVGDCAKLKAEIPVSERLLSYLRAGSPVALQLKSRPGRVLRGRIVSVRGAAHELPRTADGTRQSLRALERPERFVAVVAFDNSGGEYLPGMTGRAKIMLGRKSFLWRTARILRDWVQTVVWW
jgi:multidrug resistance efflux pump